MNHKTLPPGYRVTSTLDFMRNRRQIKVLLKLALALTVVPALVALPFAPVGPSWRLMLSRRYMWPALLAALVLYIPLHELTHGAAMLLLGAKPTFGIRLPYAYCGSRVWLDRKSHIVTALAPIALWGALLTVAVVLAPRAWFWPIWIVQISNLSGSAGDVYCAWILSRMDGDVLIQDTGVRMRVARKDPSLRSG